MTNHKEEISEDSTKNMSVNIFWKKYSKNSKSSIEFDVHRFDAAVIS